MRVTDEQYEFFRNETNDIKERFDSLQNKIGNVPMTIRFIRSVDNTLSDLQQMYFEEIKGPEEKAIDEQIVKCFKERKGW